MMFDTKKLEWTREPEYYKITPDKIEITTVPRRICGKEPIITSGMTMHRCSR